MSANAAHGSKADGKDDYWGGSVLKSVMYEIYTTVSNIEVAGKSHEEVRKMVVDFL